MATKKKTEPAAPAADQTEAVALSRIPEFQPIELRIARDILPLKGRQYELTTTDGMQEAKADLKAITSYLAELEKARKVTKDEPYKLCVLIDAEAKRISVPVELEIKAPLKAAIEQEEGRLAKIEAARVEAIQKRIALIRARPGWGAKAADIRTMLNYVETVEIDAAFAELQDDATVAKAEALRDLRQMLETATEAERQQAEQEAERQRLADESKRLREQVAQREAADLMASQPSVMQSLPAGVDIGVDMTTTGDRTGAPGLTPKVALILIRDACDALSFGAEPDDLEQIDLIRAMVDFLTRTLP